MKVFIAKHAGFCFGVKRAVEYVLKLKKDVNTIGPLIHNPQVIEKLKSCGIIPVNSLKQVSTKNLVIRAHGVPEKIIKKAKELGLNVIDLTCPFVKKVQKKAKELELQGYKVVIVGEAKHPEVRAIIENLNQAVVIENPSQVKGFYGKVGVVAQTTQARENFYKVVERLKLCCNELRVYNTICEATEKRQRAAIELAKIVDIMIVIGGYNSANTKRLKQLCSKIVETKHIESKDELKRGWFEGKARVGITAGASTPGWIIKDVAEWFQNEF